jgi:signal transduction histidine kinase
MMRATDGFTIDQGMREFRALRASILRLYTKEAATQPQIVEITRFNESIDQMLSESVGRHTKIIADDLRRASRERDEFISTASHELRSPVGAISNCAHILSRSGMSDPEVAHVADVLARQTGHLARLLEDLLDVARISRERIILKLETTDVRKCVQDAVDANSQLTAQNGQALKLDMPSLPITVHVDCTRVTQVVSNLVNNAAKYSPPSSTIAVSLSIEMKHAVIRVRDNGIGIEADLLPRMFDAFHENQVSDLGRQGLGIGLWLSRQLVEMQGGTITVHSEGSGTGAEFCVRLPLR